MTLIRKKIIRNSINAGIFSMGKEAYIVGGYLRDVLLGKKPRDIDYVVRGDIKDFAVQVLAENSKSSHPGSPRREAAKRQNAFGSATIVELKKEQMIRIVLKNGMTLDFTQLKGKIEDNLRERDFTMNALAWSPETGLIDPTNGAKDIKRRAIRAVSIDNFKNDPLRLLRVYRFVSELGWNVDAKTRQMVKHLNNSIKESASERITLELFTLLNSKDYTNALKMALADRLLENFLCISGKKLSENIKAFHPLESGIKKIPSRFKNTMDKPFSQELTLRGLLRLEQLLAGSILNKNRLRFSRFIRERVQTVNNLLETIHYLPAYHPLSKGRKWGGKADMFDIFAKAKDAAFDFLLLSGNIKFLRLAERFKKIWKKSLLISEDIMAVTKLRGGIELGRLIYRLKKMQFESKLKTKKDAIRWLKLNYP